MQNGLAVAGGYRGSSRQNAGERGEDVTDFPWMFEPVVIAFSVAVVRTTSARRSAPSTLLTRGTLLPPARAISLGFSSLFSASSSTTANATGLPSRRHRRDCL